MLVTCSPSIQRVTIYSSLPSAFKIFSPSFSKTFLISDPEGLSGIFSSGSSIISTVENLEILFLYSFIPSERYFSLIFPGAIILIFIFRLFFVFFNLQFKLFKIRKFSFGSDKVQNFKCNFFAVHIFVKSYNICFNRKPRL